jgi:hypothetical protein
LRQIHMPCMIVLNSALGKATLPLNVARLECMCGCHEET